MLRRRLLTALLLGAFAPTAFAADLPGHPEVPLLALPDHVVHDRSPDGAFWAVGSTYKASVGQDGFRYVPYLGADAPRNFPLHLRLERATVGAGDLALTSTARASRDGDVWTLDRGGARVVYELGMESVEQIVVLDDVSAGGEVRLSFRAATEMHRSRDGEGLRFANEFGEVLYGAAVAIAPDGSRCSAPLVETGDGFDIVVPADFVDGVDGPLVIDPVLSTGTLLFDSDVRFAAIDMASDDDVSFVIATERFFSSSDRDIYVYRVPFSTSTVAALFAGVVDASGTSWSEPSIAGRDSGNEFLVVASVRAFNYEIWGREIKESGGVWSTEPAFLISTGTDDASVPDVGAIRVSSFFSTNRWLVVWQTTGVVQNEDVRARLVDTNGVLGSTILFPSFPGENLSSPQVAEGTGVAQSPAAATFRVVWLVDSVIGKAVETAEITYAGQLLLPARTLIQDGLIENLDLSAPSNQLAPNGQPAYLLVTEQRALFSNNRSIVATVCGDDFAFESTSVSTMNDEGRDQLQSNPNVAFDGEDFLIAYEERATTGGERDIVFCSGDVSNGFFGLGERRTAVTNTGFVEVAPSLVTTWENSTASGNAAFLAWTNISFLTKVEGAHVRGTGLEARGYQYCEATENSTGRRAWARAVGAAGTTTDKSILISSAPVGSPCYVLVAGEASFVPLVSGSSGNLCLGGASFGRFSNAVAPVGADGVYELVFDPRFIAQPNGSVSAFPGSTWYFQGWFRDFDGQITSNLSNGVAIQF
ncbi:MAG: hypothetical protein AAF957_11295 [Planctomycetota bacterium]